jgi:general secretion pathway protein E
LCGLLVHAGKLESTDVDRALRLQREQDDWERIGSILVKLGLVSERDVAESLASQLNLELVDRADYPDERPDGTGVTERARCRS